MFSTYDGSTDQRTHTNVEKYQVRRSKKYAKHSNWPLHSDPPAPKKWKPPKSELARMKYLIRAEQSVESLKGKKSKTNGEQEQKMHKTVSIIDPKEEAPPLEKKKTTVH